MESAITLDQAKAFLAMILRRSGEPEQLANVWRTLVGPAEVIQEQAGEVNLHWLKIQIDDLGPWLDVIASAVEGEEFGRLPF